MNVKFFIAIFFMVLSAGLFAADPGSDLESQVRCLQRMGADAKTIAEFLQSFWRTRAESISALETEEESEDEAVSCSVCAGRFEAGVEQRFLCGHEVHGVCYARLRKDLGLGEEDYCILDDEKWRCPICRKTWLHDEDRGKLFGQLRVHILSQCSDLATLEEVCPNIVQVHCSDCGETTVMRDFGSLFAHSNMCPCGSFSTYKESYEVAESEEVFDILNAMRQIVE